MILPIIGLVAGLGALYCAIELYKYLKGEIYRLDDSVTDLDERVKRMEDAGQKRINYKTLEALEDAFAALDVMDREIEFDKSLIANMREHLFKARNPQK